MTEIKLDRRWFRFALRTLLLAVMIAGVCGVLLATWANDSYQKWQRRAALLNSLRDEINANYGYKDGTPRVNCGPCIRFAMAFRDRWNARFAAKAKFACLISQSLCGHVAVKLPDGSFFDGGNGVMSEQELSAKFSDCTLEETTELDKKLFGQRDIELLHQRIGGQDDDHYLDCPNYSDELTAKLIGKYLTMLAND
jgi:hypothetical protein